MEKILIVDDSVVQTAQLKSILEDEYSVTTACTAEEGLRRARAAAGEGGAVCMCGSLYTIGEARRLLGLC